MAEHVRGSRAVALSAAKTLIPTSRLGVSGLAYGAGLISALPAGPSRALIRLTTKSARLYNSMTIDDYRATPAASKGRAGLARDPRRRPRARGRGEVRTVRRTPGLGLDPRSGGGRAQQALGYYYYSQTDCTAATCRLNVGFVSSVNGGRT